VDADRELRRLDFLKETVAEGNRQIGVPGYAEIAHGLPILLGSTWIALIAVTVVTAA
jgi:hypothetical protein